MAPKLHAIAPYFLVEDVERAAEYYRDRLGFDIEGYFLDPPVFAIVKRDGLSIQLARMESGRGGSNRNWKTIGFDAYFWVTGAAELQARQAHVMTRPELRPYGMKEFDVHDQDGYVIRFGEDVPRAASGASRVP